MLTPVMGTAFALGSKPSNEVTAVTFTITGLIQEVFACVYTAMDAPHRREAHTEAIFSLFPVAFKFLRLKQVMTASKSISLWALVAVDALCFLIAARFRVGQMLAPGGARTM